MSFVISFLSPIFNGSFESSTFITFLSFLLLLSCLRLSVCLHLFVSLTTSILSLIFHGPLLIFLWLCVRCASPFILHLSHLPVCLSLGLCLSSSVSLQSFLLHAFIHLFFSLSMSRSLYDLPSPFNLPLHSPVLFSYLQLSFIFF